MIIKMHSVSGGHGGNALRYAMDEQRNKREGTVSLIATGNLDFSGIPFESPDATYVLDSMKLTQTKRKTVDKPFWRIEVCPPMEECHDWTDTQWREFVNEVITELDGTGRDRNGNSTGLAATNLAGSQWVAALHRDTDQWHVHIVANRVAEDGSLQNDYRSMDRAMIAADNIADRHEWTRAKERGNKRKERIHEDAMRVLRQMDRFDLEEYFGRMRALGYKVEARYDAKGVCRGYSIGEDIRHDGHLSSTIMYKASDLGHSRDLMASKIGKTWEVLHPSGKQQEAARDKGTAAGWGGMLEAAARRPSVPVMEQPEETFVTWRADGEDCRIPERLSRLINDEIRLPQPEDYADEVDGIPDIPTVEDAAGIAASLLVAMMSADARSGGGGGGGNDLPWGRDKDKERDFARRAAAVASQECTPAHSAKASPVRWGRRR